MAHPELAIVMGAEISASAKLLYSLLYSRTNGVLVGEAPVAEIMAAIGVGEAALRKLRSQLGPYAFTTLRDGVLRFDLERSASHRRASRL